MSVFEWIMEIGISFVIGLCGSEIMWLFLIEGVLFGVVGGVIGVLFGYGLVEVILVVGIFMFLFFGMICGYIG